MLEQLLSIFVYWEENCFQKLYEKCNEMRRFFNKFNAKNLHNNKLKYAQMR